MNRRDYHASSDFRDYSNASFFSRAYATLPSNVPIMKNWFESLKRIFSPQRKTLKTSVKPLNSRNVPNDSSEIRLFLVVRNGHNLLPAFLKHYRDLGVKRFFIVDNGSKDQTVEYLLAQPDTHVFKTEEPFRQSRCGQKWLRPLMLKYGVGHWCLNVDVDEFFVYPHYESVELKAFCMFLESQGHTAVHSLLLDLYPKTALKSTQYRVGDVPLKHHEYFDQDTHFKIQTIGWFGGVRRRVFGIMPRLDKWSLFKFDEETMLSEGMHDIQTSQASDIECVTLHFKFLDRFNQSAETESKREEHWNQAVEYKAYASKLREDPELNLFYEKSVAFKGTGQLIDLGLMKVSEDYITSFELRNTVSINKQTPAKIQT